MEKMSSSKQKSSSKGKAKEKKPIKVVYISNPMRVEASASEFKGVVQELTGQDSDISDLSKFADGGPEPAPEPPEKPAASDLRHQRPAGLYDEIFTTQELEDLTGFMPAGPLYELPSPAFEAGRTKRDGEK